MDGASFGASFKSDATMDWSKLAAMATRTVLSRRKYDWCVVLVETSGFID